MISSALIALGFGAVMFGIGYWGRRNAGSLMPATMSTSGRRSRERAIRRGAVFCQIGGWVFAALAVFEFVIWLTRG